jgi:DNA end-binding protein Ku
MIDLASHIIERKQAPFNPARFNDRYEEAMAELIKSKQAGMPLQPAPAPRPANVINLMDALRRSIAEGERTAGVKADVQEKSSKAKDAPRQRAVAASRRSAVKKGPPRGTTARSK